MEYNKDISNFFGTNVNLLPNGEFHRFGEKNAFWAVGTEWTYEGKTYTAFNYGNWKTGQAERWISWNKTDKEAAKQSKAYFKKLDEKVKTDREEKNKICAEKWINIFSSADNKNDPHEYLIKKSITSNFTAKSLGTALAVPAYNQSGFCGVQLIEKQGDSFIKRFSYGIAKKGAYGYIGNIGDKFLFMAEGFATAASIHMATGKSVIIAWDCGNFIPCLETIRGINPQSKIVICSDLDESGIGEKKANEAKSKFNNVSVIIPKLKHGTDFNDLHVSEGLDVVADQLIIEENNLVNIECLGHENGTKYFYFIHETLSTMTLTAAEHTENKLLSMGPSNYWGDRFGYKRDTTRPDWPLVVDGLFKEQRVKGHFKFENVRGLGVWLDQKRVVINLGNRLLVDGENISYSDFKSVYRYQAGEVIPTNKSMDDSENVIEAFKMFSYKKENDFIILSGWAAISSIFSVLDWRPHLWITGPRGSGKSQIQNLMSEIVYRSKHYISSSAAGIRQEQKTESSAVFIDEAEPDDRESAHKMKAIIEMIRQCSSVSGARSVRGTMGGDAISFNMNSIFCLASIQDNLRKAADVSRFIFVEMDKVKDPRTFPKIQEKFSKICSLSLFWRMVEMIPTIKENISIIKTVLIEYYEARQADTIAPILAGYWALKSKKSITPHEVRGLVIEIKKSVDDFIEASSGDESENCLNAIFEKITDNIDGERATIGEHLEKYLMAKNDRVLAMYGIRRQGDKVYIHTHSIELKKLIGNEYPEFSKIIKRHPMVTSQRIIKRIGSTPKNCIEIDVSKILIKGE